MVFKPENLDFNQSPYTGMTREHWIDAAKYLLTGIFQNIKCMDDPVVVERYETEITYPHLKETKENQWIERKAEIFEGLARSFLIAAPLIHNRPDAVICHYSMKDYYKKQILNSCTKGHELYIGDYDDLQEWTNHEDPSRAFQQTVETCALVIGLWICREEIWDTYRKEEKDRIAALISSYAHANTTAHNWRMFNMLDMAFLKMEGYSVDEEIMADHVQAILDYYVGDGWYRDGHAFDYYSCWAFNMYGPIWNVWYGYEHMPAAAKRFEEHSNKLMETYGDFFDEDGFTNMWGRSNIYRNGATSSFAANCLLRNSVINHGNARRITSGSLLQFLTREDFLKNGVPVLGFYGQFSPLVQGYSCAESPLWLGKAFLCLALDENHPFWTEKENNGCWGELSEKGIKETTLDGPALCFTNHKANGETVLRTGKVLKAEKNIHGMWNYSKLCFNTKYPWEASLCQNGRMDFDVAAQAYVMKEGARIQNANVTLWHGEKDGVLYRRQFFDYESSMEEFRVQAMNLADIPVEYGILRVDKHRLVRRPVEITLGAYGFPDNGTEIIRKDQNGAQAIILKGRDFTGREKQLAMTIYDGWQELDYKKSRGSNPDSEYSILAYAKTTLQKQYGGHEPYVLISQVITKESLEDFTEEEIFPIADVQYEDAFRNGAYGTIKVVLKNGMSRDICFEGLEGKLIL
nr:DUF2264 domain-containing protein [uncultured Blautia sp.]